MALKWFATTCNAYEYCSRVMVQRMIGSASSFTREKRKAGEGYDHVSAKEMLGIGLFGTLEQVRIYPASAEVQK